jgi:hypothetical protein
VPVAGDGSATSEAQSEGTEMNKPIPTDTRVEATGAAPPAAGPQAYEEPDFPRILDRMTPVERLRAYRSGAFDSHECMIWAARFPEEAPLVNGELEWIARDMADLD